MAIQQRRGANTDFDSTKMLPGELAVTTDGSRKVYVAFAPGDVKELASAEEVQAIVDEFNESVEENIQKATDEIEQKKEEAMAEIPNYEERLTELEVYKANSIIQTSSGQTIYETDCAAVPPVNIKLFGKGKQETVPGNQLFDSTLFGTKSSGGASITNNGDGSFTVSGEGEMSANFSLRVAITHEDTLSLLKVGRITLDCLAESYPYFVVDFKNQSKVYFELGNYTSTGLMQGNITQEMLDDSEIYAEFIFYGVTGNTIIPNTIKPMLYQDGDGTWEPYVGGEQSPNMNYPQNAEFLGESGSIVGKVLRKNHFNLEKALDATNWGISGDNSSYGVFIIDGLQPNTEYTFSFSKCLIDRQEYYMCINNENTHNWGNALLHPKIAYQPRTIVSSDDGKLYLHAYDVPYQGEELLKTIFENCPEPQLELGTSRTTYEPYTEQPFTSLTPNGLRGIPLGQTIPDAIANSPIHMSGVYWDEVEGQYYIGDTKNEDGKDVQRIGETIFDGDEELVLGGNETDEILPVCTKGDIFGIYRANAGLCDKFILGDAYTVKAGQFDIRENVLTEYNVRFYVSKSIATTVDEFKAHIAENPITLTYILADPIITDRTTEETESFNSLVMNYPNTTIVNDAGAYMEVTYLQDYDNEFTICGESDEYTTLYPNISITCKRDGDLRIKNSLTGNIFEVLNCSKDETIYVNGEHKYINSDNENHKNTTLFNDFNYNYLDINISENDFDENTYETSMPCKIVIDYSPIRKVGV